MSKNTAAEPVTLDHPINKRVTQEWRDLTPSLAEKWLGQNHDNRNIRPSKVTAFARDMRNGAWETSGDTIKFDWDGILIDGQHRCEAVLESGVTVRVLVVKGLDPRAKQVIDTGSKRTAADALRFAGLRSNATMMGALARIAIGRENGFMRKAFAATTPLITNTEAVEWVEANPEAEHAVALALATGKKIQVPTTAAWAYCLFEFQKIDGPMGVEFATSMAEMRGLRGKGDPRVALLTVFRNAAAGARRMPSSSEVVYVAFRAWNAWVTDKPLVKLVPRDANGNGNTIPPLSAPNAKFRDRYI